MNTDIFYFKFSGLPDIFIFIIRKKKWWLVELKLEMTQVLSAPQEFHKIV
jgi:hypothetical protein